MRWFVLKTKPHYEISAANTLEKMGIRSYCPVYKQIKQYSDRKKKIETPLLRSYLLVKILDKDRYRVFDVPGIIRYVFWSGKPATVREKEIELMEKNLSGIYDEISISNIKKGETFTISEGPFKGVSSKVVKLFKNSVKLELPGLGILLTLKTA